jgi:hypothetical protein
VLYITGVLASAVTVNIAALLEMVFTRLLIFIGVLGFLAQPTDPAQYLVERLVSTPDRKKGERQTTKPRKDGFL